MKLSLAISVSLILSSYSYAQLNPRIKLEAGFDFVSYNTPFYDTKLVLFNKYHISGGVQIYDRLDLLLNVGFLNTQHLINGLNLKSESYTNSLVVNYRILKDFWVSPSIRLDAGYVLNSNLENRFIDDKLEILRENNANTSSTYIFKKWKFNFSPKLMVSFKMKDFNFDVGAGYAWNSFSAYRSETVLENFSMNGITFSASLGYRFKSWKKEK